MPFSPADFTFCILQTAYLICKSLLFRWHKCEAFLLFSGNYFHVKYNTLYFTFVKVCSPRVKARTWLVPDSQSQKQKNNRRCRFFFLVTEMRFSPLRFSATVANSFQDQVQNNRPFHF